MDIIQESLLCHPGHLLLMMSHHLTSSQVLAPTRPAPNPHALTPPSLTPPTHVPPSPALPVPTPPFSPIFSLGSCQLLIVVLVPGNSVRIGTGIEGAVVEVGARSHQSSSSFFAFSLSSSIFWASSSSFILSISCCSTFHLYRNCCCCCYFYLSYDSYYSAHFLIHSGSSFSPLPCPPFWKGPPTSVFSGPPELSAPAPTPATPAAPRLGAAISGKTLTAS